MSELASRYSNVLRDIATIHTHDEPLKRQLKTAAITREDWDKVGAGAHLYFDTPASVGEVQYDTLDALTEDADRDDRCHPAFL